MSSVIINCQQSVLLLINYQVQSVCIVCRQSVGLPVSIHNRKISFMRIHLHMNIVQLRIHIFARYGKRSFPASTPIIWNSLTKDLSDVSISMNSFSARLSESWIVSPSLGTALVPLWLWQLSVESLREHKYPYLLTYICRHFSKNCDASERATRRWNF